jgi:SprT-like family
VRRGSGYAGKRVSRVGEQCSLFDDRLPERLAALGLRDVERVLTHTNQSVMLSLNRRILRIHRGYGYAPDEVLKAVVRYLNPRLPRVLRRAAEREFLRFPVQAYVPSPDCSRRPGRTRPGDVRLLQRLEQLHRQLNGQHFGGTLRAIPIRLSTRMRCRLGELAVDQKGHPQEIGLSRKHISQHAWSEVEHTMLHEMVHQWQAEMGLSVDHGPTFRAKARDVGILPAAKRRIRIPSAILEASR